MSGGVARHVMKDGFGQATFPLFSLIMKFHRVRENRGLVVARPGFACGFDCASLPETMFPLAVSGAGR